MLLDASLWIKIIICSKRETRSSCCKTVDLLSTCVSCVCASFFGSGFRIHRYWRSHTPRALPVWRQWLLRSLRRLVCEQTRTTNAPREITHHSFIHSFIRRRHYVAFSLAPCAVGSVIAMILLLDREKQASITNAHTKNESSFFSRQPSLTIVTHMQHTNMFLIRCAFFLQKSLYTWVHSRIRRCVGLTFFGPTHGFYLSISLLLLT